MAPEPMAVAPLNRAADPHAAPAGSHTGSHTGVCLRACGLTRRFGGLLAVHAVDLTVHTGQIHAVIGPNGAGKSTLINLLAAELPPSAGSIMLDTGPGSTHALAGRTADQVSHLGIGRSFQKTNIFTGFTVLENVRLAAQSRRPRFWQVWKAASAWTDTRDCAWAALQMTGLTARADIMAAHLSHGEQRQLEIAMCLATAPTVLLLDEPLAGMGHEEALRMIELIAQLRRDHAIVLVEHDMDAVFAVADQLTVMVDGAVIASGPPARIRADAAVQAAYLGEDPGTPTASDEAHP